MDFKQQIAEALVEDSALGHEHNGLSLQASIQSELDRRMKDVISSGGTYVAHHLFADDIDQIAPALNDGIPLQNKLNAEVKSGATAALKSKTNFFKVVCDALKEEKEKFSQSVSVAKDGAKGGKTDGVDPAKK